MTPAEPATRSAHPATPSPIAEAEAMLAGDAVARLDSLTVLRVSGSDASAWLQGQLTADIGEVGPTASRLAAWCSPKGRVLALFRVLATPAGDGGYLMVCERWFAATLLARLRMFILRSKVQIDDIGDELGVAGVAGVRALPDQVAAWARAAEVDDATAFDGVAIVREPGRHHRFLLTGPRARLASTLSSSGKDGGGVVRCTGPGAWHLAGICAGVARITEEGSDAFVPQMLNLDRLRAVSFTKGCYPGQEIVARTQHLGRIKRRTFVGRVAAAAPGDPVVDSALDGAPKAGEVVVAEPHPGGGVAACIVLNVASASSPALHAGRAGGPAVRIQSPDSMDPSGESC